MYLSKIELFGFKSFAHRVRITFDKGLTAIVGPNGCGKTNVVDAIRWVLGEQKSALLRSEKMENIIFNGTRSLKPLSLSEVSLTIENTRNVLPIEYTEVTITRRLYRNGESEYLLNQVPCRLRDILDLFTDTGMGSDAYSVIELKMIEEIISNKSDERLHLLEEAAGITRYKQRRKQTFRQLESTSRDLERVDDLLSEVAKKVRALKSQVRKAEKYQELKTGLRHLDLTLGSYQLMQYEERLAPLKKKIEEQQDLNSELSTSINLRDSQLQEKELRQLEQEQQLAALQKQLNMKTADIHRLEKHLVELEQKEKNLDTTITRSREAITSHNRRAADLEQEKNNLDSSLRPLEERYSLEQRQLEEQTLEQKKQAAALSISRREITSRQAELNGIDRDISALQVSRHKQEATISHLEQIASELGKKRTSLEHSLSERIPRQNELSKEHQELQRRIEEYRKELETLKHLGKQLESQLETGRERLLELRSEKNRIHNSLMLADSILQSYEGLPEGIEYLETGTAGKNGLGCLSDLISLDPKHRKAVNTALGEALGYYICSTFEEAHESIRQLTAADKGKLSFLVLEHLDSGAGQLSMPVVDGTTPLTELVSTAGELVQAVSLLLHGCYLVPDLAAALRLSRSHPAYTFVTPHGEKIQPAGIVHGGSSRDNEGLRLGRKAERDRLAENELSIRQNISEKEQEISQLSAQLDNLPIEKQQKELSVCEQELRKTEQRLTRLELEQEAGRREITRTEEELDKNSGKLTEARKTFEALQPDMQNLERQRTILREQLKTMRKEQAKSEELDRQLERSVHQSDKRCRDTQLELDKIRFRITSCKEQIERSCRETEHSRRELQNAESTRQETGKELHNCRNELENLNKEAGKEQRTIDEMETRYRELKISNQQTATALRDMRRSHETGLQISRELEQQCRELEKAIDTLVTSLQTRYECDLRTEETVIPEDFDQQKAQALAEEMRRQLQNFGAVNELALAEYEEEKQRLEFLTSQKEDLLKAETQLRQTIDEINKTALKKFEETYKEVRNNFISIFRELFEETDEADLVLTAGDDPLEGRVSIVAKPRGKKPLSIEQLSGGEKALTALSLLFAIYLVKPSPFCILDEVDAPLDDSNIDRFIKLLKKFENNTQFIIVTHNKKTMASSQALYGVTMEEEGVSKLIQVRLEKKRTEGSA